MKKHLRLISTAQDLRRRPPDNQDLTYSARELVQATLPHRAPRGNPPVWQRTNGNYTLRIHPGYTNDPKTGDPRSLGYPSGVIPRLLLFWITTEAVRTHDRRIYMGDSLSAFMREIGLSDNTGGGRRSNNRRLRVQMERLFAARISFDYTGDGQKRWLHMEVSSQGELWWDPSRPDQMTLWSSWLELGEKLFEALTARPVPVDLRALRALKTSPLALDLYAWLSYRIYTVRQKDVPVFVPWRALQSQVGADYSDVKGFKRSAKLALRKIKVLYPSSPVSDVDGGIEIRPGHYLIAPRNA